MYPYRIVHGNLKYDVFNLAIPHRNSSVCYNINNRYLGITHDETKAVEISEEQFNTCQKANGQFCSLNTPLLPLTNPPMCIAALYAKDKAGIKKRCSLQIRKANSVSIQTPIAPNVWRLTSAPTAVSTGITLFCPEEASRFIKTQTPIHILLLPPACSTTSEHFHLPPCYETHQLTINISLNTANLNVINVSSPEFQIWTTGTGPSFTTWSTYCQSLLTNSTNKWSAVMGLSAHLCQLMSQQVIQIPSGHYFLIHASM